MSAQIFLFQCDICQCIIKLHLKRPMKKGNCNWLPLLQQLIVLCLFGICALCLFVSAKTFCVNIFFHVYRLYEHSSDDSFGIYNM